jgi:hypothetical protein
LAVLSVLPAPGLAATPWRDAIGRDYRSTKDETCPCGRPDWRLAVVPSDAGELGHNVGYFRAGAKARE